ncbi:MAG TPA: NADH-quinone oxidoreductase subunit H, partial [Thermoplasmata archaeon]|nr:NADH-quinone oxidoreductase subunit H [Thermoplasmata archaeon]
MALEAQLVNGLQAATVLLLSPLIAGLAGRAKAWTESRRGPSIFQPYFDLAKYLRKETLIPSGASRVFVLAPFVAFGAYFLISIVVPIITPYPLPFAPTVDFLGGGLLFGLAGVVTLLAAMDSGGNYSVLGASR